MRITLMMSQASFVVDFTARVSTRIAANASCPLTELKSLLNLNLCNIITARLVVYSSMLVACYLYNCILYLGSKENVDLLLFTAAICIGGLKFFLRGDGKICKLQYYSLRSKLIVLHLSKSRCIYIYNMSRYIHFLTNEKQLIWNGGSTYWRLLL